MGLSAFLVQWCTLQEKLTSEKLESIWDEADKTDWCRSALGWPESFDQYVCMTEAWEELSDELPRATRKEFSPLFSKLITMEGYVNDLKKIRGADEMFLISLNPESVTSFAKLLRELDFERLREPFNEDVSEETKMELYEPDPENSFDKAFLPYVNTWRDLMSSAAARALGVVITLD